MKVVAFIVFVGLTVGGILVSGMLFFSQGPPPPEAKYFKQPWFKFGGPDNGTVTLIDPYGNKDVSRLGSRGFGLRPGADLKLIDGFTIDFKADAGWKGKFVLEADEVAFDEIGLVFSCSPTGRPQMEIEDRDIVQQDMSQSCRPKQDN